MLKGNPGPEETTTHKPSETVCITHMFSSTHYMLDWVMRKKRCCERCSHLQALSLWSFVTISSLQLWPWSVLQNQVLLQVTLLAHEFLISMPLHCRTGTVHSYLPPVFPADTPTTHGHDCLMKRYLALCELHAGWHTEHCYGHLRLLYLNDLCFTKASKGCHILKHSLS